MLGTVLLLVALGYAATTPTGTYHQEYTYKSSSSSFKNNELQHKTDDQGYYKKDGDLEGRTKPRIDANNEHSEYVNPNMNSNRYTGYGDSTDMNSYGHLNAQSGVSGYGTNNLAEGIASSDRIIGSRGYSGSGSYGASNYGSSNYGSSQYGSGSYGSDSYGSAGYGSSGYRTNSYGSSSTSIQSVIQRLQQDFERELQNHRWRDAYSQANVDRADLERQFRQNLTERLNSELLNRYGQQTIRNGMSYSISGGQVQSNANYDNQELTSLKQQLENSLINRLRNQYNQGYGTSGGSSHYQSQSESHTNYGYSSSTVRPAYQTLYPSLPIYQTTARTSYSQSNYDVINSNVRYTPVRNPEPISNIASSVQSQLDATLNQVLDEIQRKYFATSSSYQLTNYDVVLNRLQDELRNNITYLIDDNLRRNYGSQSQRDGYLYSIGPSGQISNDHNYALRDLETLKSQVERNLLEKLNREFNTYRTRYSSQSHSYNSQSNYNNYVTSPAIVYTTPRAQYSSGIKGGSIQNNYGYTAGSRQSGYEYSGGSHSGGSSYTSGTYGTADLSSLQSQLQEELSRQLQAAIRRDSSSSSSYGSYSPQNYQSSLQHLTDELNRNVSRHLQEYSASASYSASGDYDQGQIDNLKSQLLASLTSQLQQNLRQHFQSGSASSSSSYSASSSNANYRPVRAFQNNQQGQYRAGGSVTIGEECDDGPVNSYRMKRSPYEPYRSQPLSYYQSSSHSQQGYGYSGSHGHRYFGSHTYGGSSLSSNQHTGQEEDDTEVGQQEELGQEIEQEEQYVPSQHLQPKPLKFQEEPTSQTNGFHHTGQQESVDDVGQQVVEEEYENLHVGQQSEVGQQPDDGDVTALDLHHQTGQEEDNSELVGTLVHSPIQNEQHSVQTSSSQLHFLNTGFNKWRGNQGVEHVNNVNLNQQPEDIELGQQVETDLDSSKLTREEPFGQEVGQEQDDSDLTQQIEEFDHLHSGQQVVQDNVGQEVDGSAVYSTPVGHGVVSQQGSSLFSVTSHRRPGSFYQTNSGQSSSVQGGLSSGIQFSHSGNFNRNYHSGSSGFSVGVESRPLTWESIVIQRGVNSNGGHGITYWLSHDWKPSQEQLFEKSKQTLVRKLDESLSNAQTLHRKKDEILKEIARNLTQDFSLYNDDYLTKQLGFTYEEIEGLKAAVFENLRKELETKTQVINLPTQNVFESSHGSSVVSQYPSQPESEIPTANVYQGQEIDEGQQVEQDENEQDLVGGHGISFWLSRKWKPAQEPFIERVKLALMDQLDSTLKTARQYHLKKEEILRSLTISFKNDFSLYSDDYLRNQLGFTIEEIEGVRASILENLRRELDKRTQNINLQTQTVLDSSSQGSSSEVNQHPIQQWPEIPAANLHQGQQTENEWPNVKPDDKSYFGSSSQNEQDLIWLSRKWKPAQEPFIERLKLALMDKLDSTLKTARQYHLKKEEILRSLTISFKNDFSLYSDDYLRNQLGFTVEEIQGVKASILENLRTEVDKRTQNMNLQTQSVSSWNQHSSVLNHYPDQQKPAIPSGNVYVEQETDDGEQHVEQPANSYFTSSSHNVVNPIGGHNIQYWLSHDWKPSQDRFIERTKQRLLNKLDESLKTTVTLHRKKDEILEELAANLTKYFSLYNDDYFTTHLELTHDEIEGIKATILENVRKELDKKTSTGQTLTGVEFGQENLLTQTPNHDNSPIPSANLHLGQEPDNVGQHVEQASSSLHVPAVNYRKPVQTEIGQEVDDSDLTQQTEEFENLHTGQQEFNEPIGQTVDQDVGQTLEQDLENVGQTLDETDVHSVVPLSHSTNSNQLGFSQTKVVDLSGWNEKQQRFIKQLDGRLIGELSGSIGINHVQNYDSEEFNRELTVKVKNALKNYNQYFFLNYLGLKKDQLNDFETTILEYLRTEWQKTVQTSSVNVHQTGVVFNPQEPVVQEEAIQPQHIPATGGLSLQKSEEPPQVSEEPLNNVAGNAHQSGGLETTHRQTYSYNSRAEGHYGGSQGNVGVGAQVQYPYRKPARLPDSSSFINTEIGQQENNAQAGTYFSPTLTKVLAEDEQKPSSSVESSQSSVGSSNLNQESHNGNQNTGGVSRVTLQKSTGQWFGLSSQGEFATGQQSRSSAESTADALVESLRQRQTKPQVQVVEQTGESEIPANNNRGYAGYGVHQTSDDSANSRGYGHGSGYHGSSSSSFHFSGSASSGGRLNYGRQHEQEDNLETTGNINAIETGRAHAVVHQNSYQPSHPYSGVKGHRQRPYASYGSSEPGNPGYVGQSMHDPPPPEHPAVVAQEAHSSSSPPPEVTSHIYIEPTVSNEEDLPWWKKVGNKVKQGAAKVKEGAVNLKKKIVG